MITAAQRVEHTNTMGSEEKADMINQMKGSKKEIIDVFFFKWKQVCFTAVTSWILSHTLAIWDPSLSSKTRSHDHIIKQGAYPETHKWRDKKQA